MHDRSHERRCETPRKTFLSRGVFRNELRGSLRQFEHFTKRETVIPKENLSGLGFRDTNAQIHKDRVCRPSSLLVEDDRNGVVIQNFTGHYDISCNIGNDFEPGSPDKLAANFFSQPLLDSVRCRPVEKGRHRDRAPGAIIQLRSGQAVTAAGCKYKDKEDEFAHEAYDSSTTPS